MLRTARLLPLLRALDTGLRRRALPPDAASLLPGSLAITWTGLPPAGGDELADATRSDHRTHRPPIQSRVSSGHAIGRPTPYDGVERGDHRLSVGPVQGLHFGGEPSTQAFHGCPARLDQQFPVPVPANIETQEIKPCIEPNNAGFGLVEGKNSRRQPPGQG